MAGLHRISILVALVGCHQQVYPAVPGQTDIEVSKVSIEPRTGEQLTVDYGELYNYLGLRAKNPIYPERRFNPYRLAEDRRRVLSYLHEAGRFDAEVDEPTLVYTQHHDKVAVTWHVHEGPAYKIGSIHVEGVPADLEDAVRQMVPFHVGDEIELEIYRPVRRAMADRLQEAGYGHARGYSRTFVDRESKTVAWYYYLDPGPKTHIGKLTVEGNHRVPADKILERSGLSVDEPYSTETARRAEMALLDTGAFASAAVLSDADIQKGPPEHPDTGGVLAPDQVDADGKLVPRKLSDSLAVRVIVVEAPKRQLRAELGVEADPTRIDSFAGARVTLRDVFGPQHHVVLDGNVGYGVLFGDGNEPASGVYGSALAQYVHPGWLTRTLDLRVTGRWRDVLYPDALLREVVAGPGVRSTLAPGVFVDVDAFYRFGRTLDQPALDPTMTTGDLELPDSTDSRGAVLEASFIADRRNDRVEPTDGWMLALRGQYAPGGPLGDHRWLQVVGDARGFMPLSKSWSIGVRASAGAVGLGTDAGIPLGPRLFGGGSHGLRGYGRDRLSPSVCADMSPTCDEVLVGGRSLVESSVELRLLPFRKLYGAALFVDAGGAGAGTNAFENGLSLATGVGARIRSWYLPIGIDVGYRLLEDSTAGASLDRLLVFFRIGEAF